MKKIEFTINKKIVANLFVSFFLSTIVVFIFNYIKMKEQLPRYTYNYWTTAFNESVYDCPNGLNCVLEALTQDNERMAIFIISLIFWTISIINHFVKFKIK